ncbi:MULTISPECIES: MmcQ/YjbR family DNA-binding protein [unclassified Actinotalea]|uniref:MmcQ/YjbR family DNA-binding protein n=1 Tax=unclassified Actinotalea TaxID=2638618 RepID=UPI0015F5B394|nr:MULTISPECIES: MmcQ/YjbR family DNA-binding protein [unclassified Actinotalea]
MAHPRMYDDDDPLLARLRDLCAALPESVEKESWGRPTFRVARMYATYGVGAAAGQPEQPHALIFRPDDDERPALLDDARFWAPPYHGPAGWLALDLARDVDWDEVGELLASSYRQAAPARLVARLDAERSSGT